MHYNARLYARNSKIFLGGLVPRQAPPTVEGKPSPQTPPGASIFAPLALMFGAFGLHPRTLAHTWGVRSWVVALSQFVPLKLGG